MELSSRWKFLLQMAIILGFEPNIVMLLVICAWFRRRQTVPRPLPEYYAGNVLGYNRPRPFQNYGAPYYGGVGSGIVPPISAEEFRQHFMFGPDKFPVVLRALRLPADPIREAEGKPSFPYYYRDGVATRFVRQETALLVFLKRMRTRGTSLKQHTCVYVSNQTALRFACHPPTLDEYLCPE
jgi:hypothetical protein